MPKKSPKATDTRKKASSQKHAEKSKPERVLMVSEYFAPHWTGIAKSFYYLAQNLMKQGYDVTVLTTHFDKTTPSHETIDGISVQRVPYQFKISRTHYSWKIIWKFAFMVQNYDTVIINSPNSNILFYSIIAKLFGKKLVIYHQADILLPRHTGNILIHWIIERVFDVFTIPSVIMADIVSSFTKDYAHFSRVMRYSVYKFRPYIPDIRLPKGKPSPSFKKKMDALRKKHVLIGISGRFVEEKGFDVLFQALPSVLEALPNAHLVFAGKKMVAYEPFYDQHRDLFEGMADHVTFTGFLEGADLAYFYESLDVFVLSSRIECFALTQIEAWEKHVPIVVTDVAGARQLVKNSGFGEIVRREDSAALARGIVKVLKNRSRYVKNHKEAGEYLKKHENFNLKGM